MKSCHRRSRRDSLRRHVRPKWKGGRYGYGQILLASGHILVLAENGDIALVRANPERHEELVRFAAI